MKQPNTPPLQSGSAARKLVLKALLLLLPFAGIVVLYFHDDPFMTLRRYPVYDSAVMLNEEMVGWNIYRNNRDSIPFNSFILGNSCTMAFPCRMWEQHLDPGDRAIRLFGNGESMRAIYLKLQALERDSAELKNVLLVLDGTSLSRSQVQSGYSFLLPPEVSGQSLVGVQLKLLQTFALPNFLFAYLRYRMTGTISSSMKYMNPYGRIRNPQNNDALNPRERLIDEQQEAYWRDRPKEFPPRPAQEVVAAPVIGDEQAQLLRQIAALLHRYRTKVRLIISPDYDQLKLNPADKAVLDHLFGRGVVFDFSGINAYTADYHNYYERGHYRPILGERLLQTVYEENEGRKSR